MIGVVDVVVRVLPRLGGRGGVPVPHRGVDVGVVHPIPLAVHDVVADLHVLQDLGHARGRRCPAPTRVRRARGQQQHPPGHDDLALHRDDRLDVVAIAVAEFGEHLVVDRVEFLRELFQFLLAQVGTAGLSGRGSRQWSLPLLFDHSSSSTSPSAVLMQMRTSCPVGSVTSPERRSRSLPDFSVPTQVWQIPIRQPKARFRPAFSPASRIGVPPSHSTVFVAVEEA